MEASSKRARTIAELVAALGVILSLIFVGMELRQNTVAVRAATYQALSDASAEAVAALAHDPGLLAVVQRVYFQDVEWDDLTEEENARLSFYYMSLLRRLENTYQQNRSGVVDDRVFESYGWRDALWESRHFWDFWYDWGGQHSVVPDFRAFFQERLDPDGTYAAERG